MKLQTALFFSCALILISASPVFSSVDFDESRQTRSIIDFIEGTGPVSPLDPDFPDNYLVNLAEVNVTGDSDSLSLNALPDFVFAQDGGSPFPAQLVGEKFYPLFAPLRPYVQVSDLRGTGAGWKLSVSASQFSRDGAPALDGAEIRLFGGTAHSSNPALSPPEVNSPIIVECGGEAAPVTVVDALGDHNSMGAWIIRWYSPLDFQDNSSSNIPGVDLYVPSGTLAFPGDYSVTLYWTLSDAE